MKFWFYIPFFLSSCLALSGETPTGEVFHETGEHEHGSHSECPLPRTAQDVVLCARENHPEVRKAQLRFERAKAQPDAVSQMPNPSLQVQSVYGNYGDAPQMQTQISLTQPLGLGGERSARRKEAEARASTVDSELNIAKADVTFQTVIYLHRLRQLTREKAIVQDTLETYRKLTRQYRSRPALTPEQEVFLGTLEMAEADSLLRQTALLDEERKISHYFHVSTGHSLDELSKVLPQVPKTWPLVQESPSERASPEVHRLLREKEVSLAELSIAQAASWPDIRLGPMIMLDQEGPRKRNFIGFELDLPLPLFNLNGAGRAAASVGIATSERAIEIQKKDDSHERNEQLTAYRSATQALSQTPTLARVDERHRLMEKQFLRGVVPSALILESHRQLFELEKSRHERELTAVRALWVLYRIDGKILEAAL
jgi:cobalt-zinc-cadmium efflux system outer membrane protein